MTRASLYEEKQKKKALKISKYFRHDYISLQLLTGWFFATVSFALCAALWAVCNMEYLLNNIHKMDLKSFGLTILVLYVLTVAGLFLSVVRSMFLPLQSGQKKCGKLCSDFKEDLRYL